MQTVFALIVAVLIDWWGRHLPGGQFLSQSRSVAWFKTYETKMLSLVKHYKVKNAYVAALALYVPLLAALCVLQVIFSGIFGGTGTLIVMIVSLLYFLGNKGDSTDTGYVQAHETSFAIMFWFALLGPFGALTYWFLAITKQGGAVADSANPELNQTLAWVHAIAAWLPARITGFLYALVGNFTKGFSCWLNAMRNPGLPSSDFLTDCGTAATDATIVDDESNLIDRAFIAWVITCILIVAFIK